MFFRSRFLGYISVSRSPRLWDSISEPSAQLPRRPLHQVHSAYLRHGHHLVIHDQKAPFLHFMMENAKAFARPLMSFVSTVPTLNASQAATYIRALYDIDEVEVFFQIIHHRLISGRHQTRRSHLPGPFLCSYGPRCCHSASHLEWSHDRWGFCLSEGTEQIRLQP